MMIGYRKDIHPLNSIVLFSDAQIYRRYEVLDVEKITTSDEFDYHIRQTLDNGAAFKRMVPDNPETLEDQAIHNVMPAAELTKDELERLEDGLKNTAVYYKQQQDQKETDYWYNYYAERNINKERIKEEDESASSDLITSSEDVIRDLLKGDA